MTLQEQCATRKQANVARNKRATTLKQSRQAKMNYVRGQKIRREMINKRREQ